MIGHHDGRIQVDCLVVLLVNHRHYEITHARGKLELRMTAKRDEVSSSRYLQVWQLAASDNQAG